jgi:uncharacterized protein YbdZ (MbtH family)
MKNKIKATSFQDKISYFVLKNKNSNYSLFPALKEK